MLIYYKKDVFLRRDWCTALIMQVLAVQLRYLNLL